MGLETVCPAMQSISPFIVRQYFRNILPRAELWIPAFMDLCYHHPQNHSEFFISSPSLQPSLPPSWRSSLATPHPGPATLDRGLIMNICSCPGGSSHCYRTETRNLFQFSHVMSSLCSNLSISFRRIPSQ